MQPENVRRSAIESALLDFHRSPGKYARVRRQPSLLYASIREILLLAGGRPMEGDGGPAPSASLQQAAGFFVHQAMLFPDADHYALLGLEHGVDAAAVKDRYRQMMRLMHPDFSSTRAAINWPSDAAARVNQAYEVLSSAVLRRSYDEQVDPSRPERPDKVDARPAPAARSVPARVAPATRPAQQDPRGRLKRLATVFGAAGGVAVLAAWVASGPGDKESLVQRTQAVKPVAKLGNRETQSALSVDVPARQSFSHAEVSAAATRPGAGEPAAGVMPLQTPVPQPAHPLVVDVSPSPLSRASTFVVASPAKLARPPVDAAQIQATSPTPAPYEISPRVETPPLLASSLTVTPAGAATPSPVAAAPRREPALPSPTLADVHPLLARLLQELESGWGDRVVSLLDRDARSAPGAQALLQHYNGLVDGMRPVQLTNVQFKAEPRDGRLLVTGHVLMQLRDRAVAPRELAVQAEFAARDGAVVMTRLSRARE